MIEDTYIDFKDVVMNVTVSGGWIIEYYFVLSLYVNIYNLHHTYFQRKRRMSQEYWRTEWIPLSLSWWKLDLETSHPEAQVVRH